MDRGQEESRGRVPVSDTDWAATAFGEPGTWSPELRSAYDLICHTDFPAVLMWGPDLRMIYNDSYVDMILDKHPQALGAPASEVFAEAWAQIGPLLEGVRRTKAPVSVVDGLVPLERRGYLEDCWFSFCYSPVVAGDEVVGVLDIATETTRQVLAERRLATVTSLLEALVGAEDRAEVRDAALRVLRSPTALDVVAAELLLPERPGPGAEQALDDDLVKAWQATRDEDTESVDNRIHHVRTGSRRLAWQRLVAPGPGPATMVLGLLDTVPVDRDHLDFARTLTTSVAQALAQASLREVERAVAAADRDMSLAMQHALLSSPPPTPELDVAARYEPSSRREQVGGDWHDLYHDQAGAVVISIGDISGHDNEAASQMAQVRNILRGLAYDSDRGPADVLARLDRLVADLAPEILGTTILARIDEAASGHRLTWSVAGHPPPVLVTPGGEVVLLDERPDIMLGVAPRSPRHDHTVALPPGSMLVLYTDGLVERRSRLIDDGLGLLLRRVAELRDTPAETVAQRLLDAFLDEPDAREDDVALLVLRIDPEDPPRR